MILDAIISLFVSLFGFLMEGVSLVFVSLINLILAGIEAVVGIFVSGFNLKRFERKKHDSKSRASAIGGILTPLLIIGLVVWLFIVPKVINREVTLVAEDGYSLPFAAVIIHTGAGDEQKRTDNAGSILIPRFSTTAITVKDPRYVEKTWQKPEIDETLIVGRTLLGSGLDSLAERFLVPAKE